MKKMYWSSRSRKGSDGLRCQTSCHGSSDRCHGEEAVLDDGCYYDDDVHDDQVTMIACCDYDV